MILVNKNTTGAPMSTVGKTGTQVIRFIPAPRVYVKSPDPLSGAPIGNYILASNGVTPNGWQDLGIIANVKITYDKQTSEVTTGLDQYLRGAYVKSKRCLIDFEADQFDDVNLELLTGYTGTAVGTSGVNYQIGQEDLVQKAILIVLQNKLDSKEFQFYNPNAFLKFVFNNTNEKMTLAVNGILPSFTPLNGNAESFLSLTEFAVSDSVVPPNPSDPPPVGAVNHLTLTDMNTGELASIYFANGIMEVGSAGGDTSGQVIKMTDTVTQANYTLELVNGTLMAINADDATNAVSAFQMTDAITGTVYTLSIASGSLMVV